MKSVCFLLTSLLCLLQVNSMALKGVALTRYTPCGLGVVYFDKITEKVWQCVVNLGFYPNLSNIEISISFKNEMEIYGANSNTSLIVKDNWRTFVAKPRGPVPRRYIIYFGLKNYTSEQTSAPVVTRFSLNNLTLCDENIKALFKMKSFNMSKNNDDNLEQVCGRRALDYTELVSVRTEAKPGDWPWHVAILHTVSLNSNRARYKCGGSIISTTAVVTAGHCVSQKGKNTNAPRVVVIAGSNNYKDWNQPGRQTFMAEKIIVHPSYTDALSTADLAVIRVSKFKYTQYVQPICIWGPVYDKSTIIGKQAMVVGFGATEENKLADVLRSTYTMVQNDTTCINSSAKVYGGLLNEFTFCAGYGPGVGINPRNGDSGGGLVISVTQPDQKLSWFLRGVLSKCGLAANRSDCDPNYYVVYTDVAPYYGWLYHHSGLEYRSNIVN